MFRRQISLISFVLVISFVLTGGAQAELIGWWKLDESAGTVVNDSSGRNHHGTVYGDPQWVSGAIGGAIELDGDGDYVEIGAVGITRRDPRTITGWAKASTTEIPGWTSVFGFAAAGEWASPRYAIEIDPAGNYNYSMGPNYQWPLIPLDTEWHHFAIISDGDYASSYLDGEYLGGGPGANTTTVDEVRIGNGHGNDNCFPGIVDDVRVYNKALTSAEVREAMVLVHPRAFDPIPEDGARLSTTWVGLEWSPRDSAVSHNVYLGDNFDDVSNGSGDTFRGNQMDTHIGVGFPGFPYPDGLVLGTTYYWRIDEVNDANPNNPWKGDVWSFSVPPKTAYNPDPADGAEFVDPNAALSWTPGFGGKLHTVYIGTIFDDVNNAEGGMPLGNTYYSPAALESEKVYYWRVDEFDPPFTHKGDVWSFTTPGAVGNPQPANGAMDVQMIETLSWTAADNAASSELYFGADADGVKNATTASPEYMGNTALGSEIYDPAKLALDTTYYWRVDAVYPDETVKGLVWCFETTGFIVVDDFESYNNIDPPDAASNRIFDKWIDGFGTTDNGARIGNDLPPYAEQNIVHGGSQGMIYRYDNSLKTSEAALLLVYPRDWTEGSVTKLSLWFRGASANAADRMCVALNGTAAVYHNDASATQMDGWNQWVIDLTAFAGVNLTDVNTITIGIGTKNSPATHGAGVMYFDDIRLYRPAPE